MVVGPCDGIPTSSFYGIKGDSILLKTSHIIDVFYFTLRIFFIFGAKNGTEMAPIGTDKPTRLVTEKSKNEAKSFE